LREKERIKKYSYILRVSVVSKWVCLFSWFEQLILVGVTLLACFLSPVLSFSARSLWALLPS